MSDGDIRLGIQIRTQGPQSDAATMVACAEAAEQAGLDDLVVVDHIAIPPDDAEGSGGRYLDPLAALMFLAAKTRRIGLGTGVLVLPYRPILPTAKVIATLQELSGNRLRLGVGVGWMEAEFNALGVPRNRRGRLFDEGLEFLNRAFASDRITQNGQEFLFLPRPMRPPLLIGGTPPYAFDRAVTHGDGWLPMGGRRPEKNRRAGPGTAPALRRCGQERAGNRRLHAAAFREPRRTCTAHGRLGGRRCNCGDPRRRALRRRGRVRRRGDGSRRGPQFVAIAEQG